jgi:hypothetical protein
VQQRFAARDCDYGRAAFVDGFEAFFRREMLAQNFHRVLDLTATAASEVAAE